MTVMGEVAQVVGLDGEQIRGEGSLEHSVREDAREEVGEDGDDVELHHFYSKIRDKSAKRTKQTSKRVKT